MPNSAFMQHYSTQQGGGYTHVPQPPPSPPMEEFKCSLPSISNLLGLADAGSPTSETSPASRQQSPQTDARAPYQNSSYVKADSRPGSRHRGLPPTPPMSNDVSFEPHASPVIKPGSQYSHVPVAGGYYYETTPPLEADLQRHPAPPGPVARGMPAPGPEPYPQQAFPTPYGAQPPMGNYYPTPSPQPQQVSGLFYQRPLPQAFPPQMGMPMAPSGMNPWQHHHYLSSPGGAAFPQSQDRYICQTCNKAFSRPSSLRIHSHSHTGEKPFKCPHAGCGKAFSVRSNMKRHERGCHSFEVNTSGTVLP